VVVGETFDAPLTVNAPTAPSASEILEPDAAVRLADPDPADVPAAAYSVAPALTVIPVFPSDAPVTRPSVQA
jgi:hypothetical protein